MLKGIAPCVSPDLLKALAEMGHGDEIVLADAHFPGHSVNGRVLRADGLSVTTLGLAQYRHTIEVLPELPACHRGIYPRTPIHVRSRPPYRLHRGR